jgi:hypothetical protein
MDFLFYSRPKMPSNILDLVPKDSIPGFAQILTKVLAAQFQSVRQKCMNGTLHKKGPKGRVVSRPIHLIMLNTNRNRKQMVPTVCSSCNLTIHPNFVGFHKCGYGNCPVCKTPVTKPEYWRHIKTHPGHENDNPPQSKATRSTIRTNSNRHSSYNRPRES